MTVILEGSIKRWVGLSTDEKPYLGLQVDGRVVEAGDIPAGSSFLEEDTGHIYRWNGIDAWALPAVEPDEQLYVLQALLVQITQLRRMVGLAIGG